MAPPGGESQGNEQQRHRDAGDERVVLGRDGGLGLREVVGGRDDGTEEADAHEQAQGELGQWPAVERWLCGAEGSRHNNEVVAQNY